MLVGTVAVVAVVAVATPAGEAAKRLVLPKRSVGKEQLRAGAVTRPKLAANAVDGTKVVDGSIGVAELAPGAVDGSRLAEGSVGAAHLVDGAVGAAELAPGSVDSTRIADGAVGAADLGTVPGAKVDVATLGKVPAAANADALGTTIVVPVDHEQPGASSNPAVLVDRLGSTISITCELTTVRISGSVLTGAPSSYSITTPTGAGSGEIPATETLAFSTLFSAGASPGAIDVRIGGPRLILHGAFLFDPDGAAGCSLRGHVTMTPLE